MMTEIHDEDNKVPEKRAYSPPQLRVYGVIGEVTNSVTGYGAGDGTYNMDPPMTGP